MYKENFRARPIASKIEAGIAYHFDAITLSLFNGRLDQKYDSNVPISSTESELEVADKPGLKLNINPENFKVAIEDLRLTMNDLRLVINFFDTLTLENYSCFDKEGDKLQLCLKELLDDNLMIDIPRDTLKLKDRDLMLSISLISAGKSPALYPKNFILFEKKFPIGPKKKGQQPGTMGCPFFEIYAEPQDTTKANQHFLYRYENQDQEGVRQLLLGELENDPPTKTSIYINEVLFKNHRDNKPAALAIVKMIHCEVLFEIISNVLVSEAKEFPNGTVKIDSDTLLARFFIKIGYVLPTTGNTQSDFIDLYKIHSLKILIYKLYKVETFLLKSFS